MITKPSIGDLLAGLTKNVERLVSAELGDVRPQLRSALGVLDRVTNEWFGWCELLEADSADIGETLKNIGVEVPPGRAERPSLPCRHSLRAVEALEEENRSLKDALVRAIDQLDLPKGADASAAERDADEKVVALLQRMLYREASVQVAPPRAAANTGNPASADISIASLQSVLQQFLAAEMPLATDIVMENLETLTGGASREAWVFDVRWREPNGARLEQCILMREPLASVLVSDDSAEIINGTRRTVANEIRVIKAMAAVGLPVPHVLWHDARGDWLGRPFSVFRRLPGTADATPLIGAERAESLLDQYVEILSRLHRLDPQAMDLGFLGSPSEGSAALEQVLQFERNFEAQRLEALPATTYMIRWLKKNAPRASRVSVVHGDYRLGNFLYDDAGIVAILDWEQVHLGDPVEEIAFMYWVGWSLEAICPIEAFVRRYERAAGCAVDPGTLAYYRVFIEFKMLVVLLTGLKSYYATPECQLHYGSGQATEMIRDAQLRVIEALLNGGPTVAFDAYQKQGQEREHG